MKLKIVNNAKFIRSIAIVIFLLIALFNTSIAKADKEADYINYSVCKGDTLWTIAEQYKADNEDTREYIYQIKKINNMTQSNIYENQIIKIKKGQ